MMFKCLSVYGFLFVGISGLMQAAFVHPGCLSTQEDLDRMASNVAAGRQPWKGSWDILVGNQWFYYNQGPEAVATVCVDSGTCGSNYMNLARDSHRAYQCALRYHGSGDRAYADKAIQIMNAWASTHTAWDGNSNVSLRQGLYGYAFACAAELMRGYSGWNASDFAAFQQYMLNQFYPGNAWFLNNLYGRCDSHYWANWTLASIASMLAIGVLCDDPVIFDEALNHFFNGTHTGAIQNAVYYIHPNGLGQWQESGRDQGHALIGPQLLGVICEIAWNQGIDLYGCSNNRVLAGVEYISKYNTWQNVPFAAYMTCDYGVWPEVYRFAQTVISSGGRGQLRPGWDLIFNHYVNRMGMSAPYTQQYAEMVRPEGGGINYGTTSGGFDGLGFTTLTHSRDPIADGRAPSFLRPHVKGSVVTLSWRGTPYALSYTVKRSAASGGPYTALAVVGNKNTCYVDTALTAGTTYYYVVSANNPSGPSPDSAEASAAPDGQLYGTVIGTDGSYGNYLAEKSCLFDGCLKNFFDSPNSTGDWAGLDLGSGVRAVITQVRYCPRRGFAGRMVGGRFQGSNDAVNWTTLYTITFQPPEGVLTQQPVSSTASFRYVRYLGPSNSYCNAAEVQFVGTVSGKTAPAAPAARACIVNGCNADITWDAVADAIGYRIARADAAGGPRTILEHTAETSWSDKGLTAGTTYYYIVSAYNDIGQTDSAQVVVSAQPTGPSLTACYALEGNVCDSSGNGYHAAAAGAPAYAEGRIGQAIVLDGTDDYILLPAAAANYEDITVAAWVYWNGGNAWQRIFDFGNNTSQYLFLTPRSGSNTLRFAIKNGGSEQIVETAQLPAGRWVHLAVTLEGTTARLYVDGLLKAVNSAVTLNPSDFKPAVNYIGDSQYSADPLFSGRLDDVRIYNYALPPERIAALYAGSTGLRQLANLAQWWLTADCGICCACGGADLSGDGKIDFEDFSRISRFWSD